MLQNFYHFREQPFGVNPDPRFLYLGRTHREAFASLLYRIEMDSGFLAMIAQPGMGKTTLLFHLLRRLQPTAKTAFIFQTQCTSSELLRHLISEFECSTEITDSVRISRELKTFMLAEANAGRRCVLVIDEAQNLGPEVLETIRLLSNFETPRRKLLNIILSGQIELGEMLARPDLQQLRQRLSCIVRIERFTPGETALYIAHRLYVAGYSGKVSELFSLHALAKIAQLSNGIPRIVNNLCFNALSLGYALGRKQIDLEMIEEVAGDLGLDGEAWKPLPVSQQIPLNSADVISEVSTVYECKEPCSVDPLIVMPEMAEASASEKGSEKGIDTQVDARPQAQDDDRILPVTANLNEHVPDHTSAEPYRTAPKRATGTLLARSLLCAVALLLTPAIDLPERPIVSAHAAEISPTVTPELNVARVKMPRQPRFRNRSRTEASPLRTTVSSTESRNPARSRYFALRSTRHSRMPVDLALAAFAPEPLLKPQPLAPTAVPARRPSSTPVVSSPPPSALMYRPRTESIRRSFGYVPPKPIWQPAPTNPYGVKHRYPAEDVQLVLFVSSIGDVYDVGILGGDRTLASAAESAVRQWKYAPALSNGAPVDSKIFVTIQFSGNGTAVPHRN